DRGHRRRRAVEHVEERIALHADAVSARGIERAPDDAAVVLENGVEARLADRLHEARRALDVREHERQRAGGERRPGARRAPAATQARPIPYRRDMYPQPDCPTPEPSSENNESTDRIVARCDDGMWWLIRPWRIGDAIPPTKLLMR